MSFVNYLKETKGELRHVNWPTRRQATIFTVVVIVLSIFVSLYLGLFDFLFTTVLQEVITYFR